MSRTSTVQVSRPALSAELRDARQHIRPLVQANEVLRQPAAHL